MPSEDIAITAGIAGAAYLAQQLFGKTLAEIGGDISNVYKSNRDKLLIKAAKKVADPNDGAKPNLRVARDVLWNGSVTGDEVCAEYFGGLLAASRSPDGKDDSSLIYVDCIKALSSKQLHLHYAIYSSLEAVLIKTDKTVNPGMQDELSQVEIWFATNELTDVLGLNPFIDLNVLHRQGLVSAYATNNHIVGDKTLPYAKAQPSTFGVLLFAAALNSLSSWHQFGRSAFTGSKEIGVPAIFASSLAELSALVGLTKEPVSPDDEGSE